MLKRSIGIGIMCLASHAYSANIVVTTQDDVTANDSVCSLREAVDYINAGMPTAGLNGCGGKDAAAVIELQGEKTYNINSRMTITKPLQLKSTYSESIDPQLGLKNAIIKMLGNDLIFNINDGSITENPISVNFNEITLEGCGLAAGCNTNGGIISNQEQFKAEYVIFKNGVASSNGGAIFNIGNLTNEDKSSGYVTIINSIFTNNKAVQGAVIYSELPRFNVFNTVIRNNESTGSTGTLLFSATKFTDTTTTGNFSSRNYGLKNSTIFSNTGFIINVLDGMVINNITALRNSKGIILNAPLGNASLSNSILLENGRYHPSPVDNTVGNCRFETGDTTKLQKNLVNAITADDCNVGTTENPNTSVGSIKVIAGNSVEGACDLPPADGLLCPYRIPTNRFLGYFKPRILASYTAISQSPIVNRGRFLSNGTVLNLASCETQDQRGQARGDQEVCDLGAIELIVDATSLDRVGKEIKFGEIAEFSIADNLADGELVAADQCPVITGSPTDSKGNAWQPGCLEIVQTNTPSKGKITLTQSGDVRYVPDSNWHGSDEFNIRVITTLTRLNESTKRYLQMSAKIVQDPPNSFQNKSVNTGSGAIGFVGLMALLGLIGLRRSKAA